MKKITYLSVCLVLGLSLFSTNIVHAKDKGTISHVVLVWLKKPGDVKMREQFVASSKRLNSLPGIISRHVGVVKSSDRGIVDDTFDVAITVTLKDQAAFNVYMNAPLHKKIVEEKLKPMINRIVAYDFVSE